MRNAAIQGGCVLETRPVSSCADGDKDKEEGGKDKEAGGKAMPGDCDPGDSSPLGYITHLAFLKFATHFAASRRGYLPSLRNA